MMSVILLLVSSSRQDNYHTYAIFLLIYLQKTKNVPKMAQNNQGLSKLTKIVQEKLQTTQKRRIP